MRSDPRDPPRWLTGYIGNHLRMPAGGRCIRRLPDHLAQALYRPVVVVGVGMVTVGVRTVAEGGGG